MLAVRLVLFALLVYIVLLYQLTLKNAPDDGVAVIGDHPLAVGSNSGNKVLVGQHSSFLLDMGGRIK